MKHNRQKISQRQRMTVRLVVAVGISFFAIATGIFLYLQLTNSESSKADNTTLINRENLPVDMVIDQMVVNTVDTIERNGNRCKVAKPLSLTPVLTQ